MNPLVSLFCRLVARGGRKRDNGQRDRQDGQTHLQTKYRNRRSACALRVNDDSHTSMYHEPSMLSRQHRGSDLIAQLW